MAKVFDIALSGNLRRALDKAARTHRDMTAVWRDVGEHMVQSIQKNFEVGGRPDKWEKTKTSTLLTRFGKRAKTHTKRGKIRKPIQRKLGMEKTLVRSGRLMNSISYRLISDGVVIGTNLDYAAIHNFGGKTGRGGSVNMPQRQFMVVQSDDEDYIANAIKRRFMRWF